MPSVKLARPRQTSMSMSMSRCEAHRAFLDDGWSRHGARVAGSLVARRIPADHCNQKKSMAAMFCAEATAVFWGPKRIDRVARSAPSVSAHTELWWSSVRSLYYRKVHLATPLVRRCLARLTDQTPDSAFAQRRGSGSSTVCAARCRYGSIPRGPRPSDQVRLPPSPRDADRRGDQQLPMLPGDSRALEPSQADPLTQQSRTRSTGSHALEGRLAEMAMTGTIPRLACSRSAPSQRLAGTPRG
ncbi:hypothetical protein QBC34DRAFT_420459 [Podospora aff. communis PSN243]|uniref:Uncharacterized protein n=1 Tax=Podospora aff. communis PSN243 TaxID=3040156 RepID=A0AAV9H4Q7_9PEZI|nr:hypothetical protein QBC34DRAFT_420459 [Podospora aff. communis PSN243]